MLDRIYTYIYIYNLSFVLTSLYQVTKFNHTQVIEINQQRAILTQNPMQIKKTQKSAQVRKIIETLKQTHVHK